MCQPLGASSAVHGTFLVLDRNQNFVGCLCLMSNAVFAMFPLVKWKPGKQPQS